MFLGWSFLFLNEAEGWTDVDEWPDFGHASAEVIMLLLFILWIKDEKKNKSSRQFRTQVKVFDREIIKEPDTWFYQLIRQNS